MILILSRTLMVLMKEVHEHKTWMPITVQLDYSKWCQLQHIVCAISGFVIGIEVYFCSLLIQYFQWIDQWNTPFNTSQIIFEFITVNNKEQILLEMLHQCIQDMNKRKRASVKKIVYTNVQTGKRRVCFCNITCSTSKIMT